MSAVEYDLDVTGGLMPQIQALLAPPVSEDAKVRKKEVRHPYYRRPGKGHNHDTCDACSEGGNLLCCDRCPASFHLLCHDPPLNEEDIPRGMWLCHCCRVTPAAALGVKSEVIANCSHVNSKNEVVSIKQEVLDLDPESRAARLARRRETTTSEASDNESKGGGGAVVAGVKRVSGEGGTESSRLVKKTAASRRAAPVLRSLQTLIQAAAHMNPTQFELPYEMTQPIPFPGTDKIPIKHRRTSLSRKKPYELDNGLVPLPARLCHECRRSCRKAPLLSCDYCPLLFHQDCLDPPLTSLPSGRWMCPAHPQHCVDHKLLQNTGACERLRLWDKFCSGSVDQDTIKVDFFRAARVNQYYPKRRMPRVQAAAPNLVRVPEAVKHHYAHAQPLFPLPNEPIATTTTSTTAMDPPTPVTLSEPQKTVSSTAEEQEQWLTSLVALQSGIAQHLETIKRGKKEAATKNESRENFEESRGNVKPPKPAIVANGTISNGELEDNLGSKPCSNRLGRLLTSNKHSSLNSMVASLENRTNHSFSELEHKLDKLDESLIRALALQRLQQLCLPPHPNHFTSSTASPTTPPIPPPPSSSSGATVTSTISSPPSTVWARAVLYPLFPSSGLTSRDAWPPPPSRDCCPMPYRTLTVGLGEDVDVCLSKYGHCENVSSKHAAIFYDESTQHYELLNYSEYGTTVDNVFYSFDVSPRPEPPPPPVPPSREPTLAENVRQILDTQRKRWRCLSRAAKDGKDQTLQDLVQRYEGESETGDCHRMSARALKGGRTCSCNPKTSALAKQGAGWEGTALLNHGSHLRFGCLQFVFSVTQCAPKLMTS